MFTLSLVKEFYMSKSLIPNRTQAWGSQKVIKSLNSMREFSDKPGSNPILTGPAQPSPSRPHPARPWRYLTVYFTENLKDVKFEHNLYSSQYLASLSLIVWKLCIFFGSVATSVIFSSFFIITYNWEGYFEFWWFQRKDLVQIYQNIPYLFVYFVLYL